MGRVVRLEGGGGGRKGMAVGVVGCDRRGGVIGVVTVGLLQAIRSGVVRWGECVRVG